ncbi:MAG: DUF1697 domain-containing protein [Chthoniobacterales bacterium]
MPRLIALLRAINVGGRNVAMAELRRQFEAVGCKGVETFIASGNVIFSPPAMNVGALQQRLEEQLRKSLGYEVKVFIRTESEIAVVARHQPFHESQLRSARTFSVGFLNEPPGVAAAKSVMALKSEIDDFEVRGREVYWLCQRVQSKSRFSNARFEKLVKTLGTWRGMNTIVRLAAKYPPLLPSLDARDGTAKRD